MFMRNMKYVKGHGNFDSWEKIPDKVGVELLRHFEKYAKEKGFDVPSYMEFIKETVIKEVTK